jgi:hypothetical protein
MGWRVDWSSHFRTRVDGHGRHSIFCNLNFMQSRDVIWGINFQTLYPPEG